MSATALRPTARKELPIVMLCALMVSCTTLRVPAKAPVFPDKEFHHTAREGVDISVRPIVTVAEHWQLFDDYLPKIGIVALWVKIRNLRDKPIAMNPKTWLLSIENRNHSVLTVPELFSRYYAAHGIRMYGTRADRTARLELENVALSPTRLSASDTREGFLFFRIDPEIADLWSRAATLVARDIELNDGTQVTLEIALSHVTP